MRLLMFGQTGQVARELQRRLPAGVTVTALGREQADLRDPKACAARVAVADADAVVNAAAYTAVDRAESEEPLATVVNGDAPGAMARACAARGLPFVHISSDYVFDGAGDQPWSPDAALAPISAYGRSKAAGEAQIIAAGGQALILRTSWVFSVHGANFVKTMLRLGAERDSLNVVADQVGGPTPAAAVADAVLLALQAMRDGAAGGIHHFAGAPDTSWAEFARAIMAGAGLACRVTDIPSASYPSPAQRPTNSRLDCQGFEQQFGIGRPDWRDGLGDMLRELGVAR